MMFHAPSPPLIGDKLGSFVDQTYFKSVSAQQIYTFKVLPVLCPTISRKHCSGTKVSPVLPEV
eukprot:1419350-Amphidinium_carterae.1